MSDHTEIDMYEHGAGGQDDFDAWLAELDGRAGNNYDEVRTVLELNHLLDGKIHHLASRDSVGPLDIVAAPFIMPQTVGRKLFRVLFTQHFSDRERASLNGAIDCIIEPEPRDINPDALPQANVWVMDEVAQRDAMGAVPEAQYDYPSHQAIIVSNAIHEARLLEMIDRAPILEDRYTFLGRAASIDQATYRHNVDVLSMRLVAA